MTQNRSPHSHRPAQSHGQPPSEGLARAPAAVPNAVILTDARQDDNPIVYCNPSFLTLTGYEEGEVLGRHCRFLQGDDTDRDEIARLREAIAQARPIQLTLLNYRKDGTPFWND